MPDFVCSMINVLSTQETTNLVDYGLKKEVIKSLCALLKAFPKKLTNQMNEILTQVWSCLVQSTQLYVDKVVNSDSFTNDSEGNLTCFDIVFKIISFMNQSLLFKISKRVLKSSSINYSISFSSWKRKVSTNRPLRRRSMSCASTP